MPGPGALPRPGAPGRLSAGRGAHRRRDGPYLGPRRMLVDVAVSDGHVDSVVVAVALGEVVRDRDRAMAPSGAADRDHQVRLALRRVLGQQEVEQVVQAFIELLKTAVARDELDHCLVAPGELA